MHFQYKAKGILVIVYAVVPAFVLLILTSLLDSYCFNHKIPRQLYGIVFSLALIISGLWTFYTSDDYYFDEHGDKQYMYFDNQFMFIDMKTWAYVFWTVGGFAFIGCTYELIELLTR